MAHFRHLLALLFASILSGSLQAQSSSEMMESVLGKINEVGAVAGINLTEVSTSQLSGTVEMWGNTANVDARVSESGERYISSLTLSFANPPKLDLVRVNRWCGGQLTSHLPAGFPVTAGVGIKELHVGLEGKSVSKLSGTFTLGAGWTPFGTTALAQVSTTFEAIKPFTAERSFNGTIDGKYLLGSTELSLSAILSTGDKEIILVAQASNIPVGASMDALFNSVGAGDVAAIMPSSLKGLTMDQLRLELKPQSKNLSFSAQTSAGDLELQLDGKGKQSAIFFALAAPSGFKFSDLDGTLAPLDGLSFGQATLVFSTRAGEFRSTLPAFKDTDGLLQVRKGLNVASTVTLDDNLKKVLKTSSIALKGFVAMDLRSAGLEAEVKFADLGSDDVQLSEVRVGFEVGVAKFDLYLAGQLQVTLDEDVIAFNTEIRGSPIDMDLQGSLYLEALKKAGQAADETAYWREPFGLPYISIAKLGGSVGVSPKSPIALSMLGVVGDAQIGAVQDYNKHLMGRLDARLDIADPAGSLLAVELNNLTLAGLVDAFSETALSPSLRTQLEWGFEEAYAYFVPRAQTFMGKQYEEGIAIGGKVKIAGWGAHCDFSANMGGIHASGYMDPITYKDGDFTLFALTAATDPNAGPSFEIALDTDPKIKIDANVTVLEIETKTIVDVSKDGMLVELTGNVLNGALEGKVKLSAPSLESFEGFYVEVRATNRMQTALHGALIAYIESEHKKNSQDIKNAENTIRSAKAENDFERGFYDATAGAVSLVGDMERAAAAIGKAIVDGTLRDAINIRSISFAGGIDKIKGTVDATIDATVLGTEISETVSLDLSMTDIEDLMEDLAEQMADAVTPVFGQIGSTIEEFFNDLAEDAETFFVDMGDDLATFGNDFLKATDYIGQSIGLDLNFNRYSDYQSSPSPNNGTAPDEIPSTLTRFKVVLTDVTCGTCDESDISTHPGCEFYGNAAVSTTVKSQQNKGSNQYILKLNKTGVKSGGYMGSGATKDFYIPDVDIHRAAITFTVDFWEDDNGFNDDKIGRKFSVSLADVEVNGKKFGKTHVSGGGNSFDVSYEIVRYGKPEFDRVFYAIKAGLETEVKFLASQGADLLDPRLMDEAVAGKHAGIVNFLQSRGNPVTARQLDRCIQAGDAEGARIALQNRVIPRLHHVSTAVANKDAASLQLLIKENATVTTRELEAAWDAGFTQGVNIMLKHGVLATPQLIDKAFQKKDQAVLLQMAANKSPFERKHLQQAIRLGDTKLVETLAKRIPPRQEELMIALNDGQHALYFKMLDLGATLTNNDPVDYAVANNNFDIFQRSLAAGGDPSLAMQGAARTDQGSRWILEALNRGGNPDYAIDYALRKGESSLFQQLVDKGASANLILASAVTHRNRDAMKVGLERGADPNGAVEAARYSPELMEILLAAGAAPDPAMLSAIEVDNPDYLNMLIRYGANPRRQELVMAAVSTCRANALRVLLDNGANPQPAVATSFAEANRLECSRLLLEAGGSPQGYVAEMVRLRRQDHVVLLLDYGASPDVALDAVVGHRVGEFLPLVLEYAPAPGKALDFAVELKDEASVRKLLAFGAVADEGMDRALKENMTTIALLLLQHGAGVRDRLHMPAEHGNLELVTAMVEAGADPADGLDAAVRNNHTEVSLFLIDKGAPVQTGMLQHPAGVGNIVMVRALVDAGADPNEGIYPSVDGGHQEVLVFLVERGGDASAPSLIRLAVIKNHGSLIKVLAEAGSDPMQMDGQNNTLLHLAAAKQATSTVDPLMALGININAQNSEGNTALHVAGREHKKNVPFLELLISHKADPCLDNNDGKSVRKYAKGSKNSKFLKHAMRDAGCN